MVQVLDMSDKRHPIGRRFGWQASAVVALTILANTAVLAQSSETPQEQHVATSAGDFQRYEAERLRQQQMRFELERQRQENERRERERMRLEVEQREQEQLRLENEAFERERAQVALQQQQAQTSPNGFETGDQSTASSGTDIPDIYEQLRIIAQLRDEGILTDEEFADLKRKILN
jgi:hypothetical protein